MATSVFTVAEHTIPTSHIREYPRATVDGQDDVLHLAVKQYTPRQSFKAEQEVTVIGAHANGFPKELYEPLWEELYLRLKSKGIRIRSIWIADVAHQGVSGVLNEDRLGNDPSWLDHPRDLFLMVNHFRAQMQRPIIGVGHSMGGNNLVNLSLMHPRLFTTLILIDPVIQAQLSGKGNFGPATMSAKRRDRWPSRDAARTAFLRSKFYQTWDPRVLERWITYGLRDLPTALYPDIQTSNTPPVLTTDPSTATVAPDAATEREVTLITTKHQEVFSFVRPNFPTAAFPDPSTTPDPITHPDVDVTIASNAPFYNPAVIATFQKLPFLRPSVLYLYGSLSDLSAAPLRAQREARTGIGAGGSGGAARGRVKQHLFEGVGHLIPMEVVGPTADVSAEWIVPELRRWREAEEVQLEAWAAVPRPQRTVLSDEFSNTLQTALRKPENGTIKPKM